MFGVKITNLVRSLILGTLGAIAGTVLQARPAVAAWHYTVSDYPGATSTILLGFNNHGLGAGFATGFTNVADIPFYYNPRTDLYAPIPALPGFDATEVWNLNDWGTVAGIAHSNDYSVETAFIRDWEGNVTLLPHPGFPHSEAQGINDLGMVVGEAYNTDFSQSVGFIYDPLRHSFTDFLPSPETEVHGINNFGEVAGEVTLSAGAAYPNSPAGSYGFIRMTRGAITLFRVNGMDTYARAINDLGVIAGEVFDTAGNASGFVISPKELAVLCRQAAIPYRSVTVKLLIVPGQAQTYIQAVTDRGQLAGVAIDASGGTHGFVAEWK